MRYNSTNRVGETRLNNNGNLMKIVEYISSNNITVMFNTGEIKNTTYRNFAIGQVKSYFDRTVYKKGFIGIGSYKSKINNVRTIQYEYWKSMLKRCYDENYINKYKTYNNCKVCDEWLNFQNFAKWFDKNYYEIESEKMCLDKDILHKGNKIYSPNSCVFVPNRINLLFTKRQNKRGRYPIGVAFDKTKSKFKSYCHTFDGLKNLGYYDTELKAFNVYKQFKENYIKQVADEYKDKIPQKLYNAMYKWEVNIND